MKQKIGFAGMTHLGLNSAVATAERGFPILCFDENSRLIADLQNQKLPVVEPSLPELLAKNFNNIKFSDNAPDLKTCDVVYIAIDVPTNDKGESDLKQVSALIQTVAKNLNEKAILVILCQVPPGFTREINFPKERLYYQVETLIFGRAIERALHPERFIIGCHNPKLPLPKAYQTLLEAFNCPLLPMRYESAELAKISINFCLVASIGVANTLSEICESIGADWSEIVPALKLDKRIGPHAYLAPGLGIAGGNLERDLTTVIELAEVYGTDIGIVNAWLKNSQYRRDWALKSLHQTVLKRQKQQKPILAILGLAYKENTHSIKNSPAISLLQSLKPYQVQVYDPAVSAEVVPFAQGKKSVPEALAGADALVIMTPWAEFRDITPELLKEKMQGRLIIDPYRVLDAAMFEAANFQYLTLGTNASISC